MTGRGDDIAVALGSGLCRALFPSSGYIKSGGAEVVEADVSTLKPVLTLSLEASRPNIGWTKQGMDALEIQVDRDGKGFVFLTIDTVPDYLDTAPLPAASAGAVWKYRAVYRLDDQQVGQWSDIASIAVGLG